MANNHFPDFAPKDLHQPKRGAAQKGCLVKCKHTTGLKENNLCSYRWQALEKAKIDSHIYNYPAYSSLCVDKGDDGKFRTGARMTKKGNCFPRGYAKEWMGFFWKDKPTHEGKEWDLGKGKNFKNWTKPWWHNAHHIIPASMLKAAITDSAEKDDRLPILIGGGLLKAEYNLHDLDNMIVLPQGTNVAFALKLPRHLRGDQVGPNQEAEYCDHPNYSLSVKKKLMPVIDGYVKALNEALGEDHPEIPSDLSKKSLEDVSKGLYDDIIAKGKDFPGEAISDIMGM